MPKSNELVIGGSNTIIISEDINGVDKGKMVVDMEPAVHEFFTCERLTIEGRQQDVMFEILESENRGSLAIADEAFHLDQEEHGNSHKMVHMEYLEWKSSDHCPMLIDFVRDMTGYGPHPFRFQDMWCSHESFNKCVEDVWSGEVSGMGLIQLAAELKRLKSVLRVWNKEVFSQVDHVIKVLEERMNFLECQLQDGHAPDVEGEYLRAKAELELYEHREEIQLAQQVKRKWLKEGDRNTRFFHDFVNQHRKASAINRMVLPNEVILETPEMIHLEALNYFRNFLTEEGLNVIPKLGDLVFSVVSDEENLVLSKKPSEEVWNALSSVLKNSSPEPDGFSSAFFIHCWETVKKDVIEAACDFFQGKAGTDVFVWEPSWDGVFSVASAWDSIRV
ncbi:uncharacterized protein LOC121258770 [Juglans microcarpa x Juglans regia]|uniref:uncharacterized protein LOC121258770 n=1 Tax=Juglans microcarpa x Juglans regia TaxID=2249226 RepID=UPI001B7EDA11|nr:uncharacterized protein LOC121258770 [Juglans microcarpa x Juglans regia]